MQMKNELVTRSSKYDFDGDVISIVFLCEHRPTGGSIRDLFAATMFNQIINEVKYPSLCHYGYFPRKVNLPKQRRRYYGYNDDAIRAAQALAFIMRNSIYGATGHQAIHELPQRYKMVDYEKYIKEGEICFI